MSETDIRMDSYLPLYGSTVGVYDGTEYGRLCILREYHECIRVFQPERDAFIMSNTWGDRSQDGKVNESFMLKEIDAAKALGITHVQIDDGWQKGTTSNSVMSGGSWGDYYSHDDSFWDVHPGRFPNGLNRIVQHAGQVGIRLGLWYSPDSSGDFQHWKKDAKNLIRLYEQHHIGYFKLDGIRLTSKVAEANLIRLMQAVIKFTHGAVYFNLDTTAEVRLGYYGKVQYGGLFLENRYTDWGSYYPHWTFRNLWMLCKYIPARKLQMEFLNVRRNREVYGDDPLSPSQCGIVYAFLVTLFSNPLAWMECSSLEAGEAKRLAECIRLVKPHHHNILSGHILPIGEEPSGTGWSGLQSLTDESSGYLLIVREFSQADQISFKLWRSDHRAIRLTPIVQSQDHEAIWEEGADRQIVPEPDGNYVFHHRNRLSAAVYQYEWL